MIDIVTVGAGGGSIAAIDRGGALKVGPRSAGASPGPACYMRGGKLPTVTDANIVLGKLNPHKILGGRMDVDRSLAEHAITEQISGPAGMDIADAAAGIISVVNSNMIRAIRYVSVERGYDPREFALMAFGGAGPLHACEIARDIGIRQVLIPPSPGTLCSLGLLMADTRFDSIRSNVMPAVPQNAPRAHAILTELIEEGNALLEKENIEEKDRSFLCTIECRYEHQNYEIAVEVDAAMDKKALADMIEDFHAEHQHQYGYANRAMGIQMVNYRVSSIGAISKPDLVEMPEESGAKEAEPVETRQVRFEAKKDFTGAKIYKREDLPVGCVIEGPAIIEQMDSTSVIPASCTARVDGYFNILVKIAGDEQ